MKICFKISSCLQKDGMKTQASVESADHYELFSNIYQNLGVNTA